MALDKNDESIFALAKREDLGADSLDITSQTLFQDQTIYKKARIYSKEKDIAILCGVKIAQKLASKFHSLDLQTYKKDGAEIHFDETILTFDGEVKDILMIERIALNFINHLSAIATLTHQFVNLVKSTDVKILDTRKTTPGLRKFEKYAVLCGGGVNHRFGLSDKILIKRTHLKIIGSLDRVLKKLPKCDDCRDITIEINNLQEIDRVLKFGQDKIGRVLLDNMEIKEISRAVKLIGNKFIIEASGNVNLANVLEIAKTGVDYISIGMLTHSAPYSDFALEFI